MSNILFLNKGIMYNSHFILYSDIIRIIYHDENKVELVLTNDHREMFYNIDTKMYNTFIKNMTKWMQSNKN